MGLNNTLRHDVDVVSETLYLFLFLLQADDSNFFFVVFSAETEEVQDRSEKYVSCPPHLSRVVMFHFFAEKSPTNINCPTK